MARLFVIAVSEERANMTTAAAEVDVDDSVADPSNGDCAAVSFRPTAESSAAEASSDCPQLRSSSSADSTVRQAAVAALGNNETQRPAAEVTSAPASSAAEEEER